MISAKNVADNFDDYFVSPGTTLTNQMTVPNDWKDMFDFFNNGNISSAFLCGVKEFDMIETVRKKQTNKQLMYILLTWELLRKS